MYLKENLICSASQQLCYIKARAGGSKREIRNLLSGEAFAVDLQIKSRTDCKFKKNRFRSRRINKFVAEKTVKIGRIIQLIRPHPICLIDKAHI